MDASELTNWMAYELSNDNDFRDKINKEIALEKSKQMDDEQRSNAIKEMFNRIANNGANR